jgi:hypothetical protein
MLPLLINLKVCLPFLIIHYLKKSCLPFSKASYEETLIKLANAEIEIEGLKNQLDDALSSEDMVILLTERNLMLGEVYLSFSAFLFLPHCSCV